MDPADVLKAAMAVVIESDVPEHLQPVALGKVMDLVAGSTQQPSGAAERESPVTNHQHSDGGDLGVRGAAIAKGLDIDVGFLERLFDEHEGVLQFAGDLAKLGNSRQAKVEKLSLVLCAARQSGAYDQDGRTPDSAVRAEIQRHGLYDVANYTKHLKYLKSLSNVNGSGKAMTYKLKYEGRVAASDIVKALLKD